MLHARRSLEKESNVVFAHRYITRPHDAGGENHVALSEAEFDSRLARKLFSMHWQSHGIRYGIGCEINQWLAMDLIVIMNGSREYLPLASKIYPELMPLLIEVSPDVLRNRLQSRGRETASEIESRLMRAKEFDTLQHPNLLRFCNDAQLDVTGPAFVELICSRARDIQCS